MRKLKQIDHKNSNNIIHKSLKDIKLPDYLFQYPHFSKYNFPIQHNGEPDQHYYFKLKLGYSLFQYVFYNHNPLFNPNKDDNPFFSNLKTTMIYYEKPHLNIKVVKVNEQIARKRLDGNYYYTTDIWWKMYWNGFQYDVLIEINGGIHTKNSEQKTNNRIRYNQIKEYYDRKNFMINNKSGLTKMIMIIFESDEWKYHTMDYFIKIIIDTILKGRIKYPDPFLFEL